jgi:hypothetical protein
VAGSGRTVRVTLGWLAAAQRPEKETVYVVVVEGLATGSQEFGSERSVAGDHEQVGPPVAWSCAGCPAQIVVGALAVPVVDGTVIVSSLEVFESPAGPVVVSTR